MKTFKKFILVGALLLTHSVVNVAYGMGQKPPTNDPDDTPTTSFKASWEKSVSSRSAWTQIVRDVVNNKASNLLRGPSDVTDFCPMYDRLGTQDRLNFWAEFFSSVAKYESGWSPTSRMIETTMGIDPYTGRQVASEGLLQLSYQDVQWAPYCEFNWSIDKQYSNTDARKSIFDPKKNLSCGIQILDRQVASKGKIALSTGVYWAVLKVNGKYTKLNEIRSATKALSFCKK
jgi:hypothetical protein